MARNINMMIVLFLISAATIVSGLTTKIIKAGDRCGEGIEGLCAPEAQCSTGVPSFCIPSKFFSNSSIHYKEVTGYGRPMAGALPTPEGTDDTAIPVFVVCTDSQFRGNCLEFLLACDFCGQFGAGFINTVSSVEMLDTRVGCNFWVNSNCIGDGINVDSGAIFDLSATNYNDRTVAFNCYLTGR